MSFVIPKQELLIKLLSLTASDNDAEALSALRKATKILNDSGWTWERLIHGKITVIADPFASLATPPTPERQNAPPAPPRPMPAAPRPYTYTQPRQTWPAPKRRSRKPTLDSIA